MAEIGVVFVVSFVGAALGATLGVRVLSHDRTTGL